MSSISIPYTAARRPRGGVVTQRTANPCTPVRFWARPPSSLMFPVPRRTKAKGFGNPGPAPLQPVTQLHCEIAPEPAHRWKINGQHDQSKGNHPEAQNRHESKHPAKTKGQSQGYAKHRMARYTDAVARNFHFWHDYSPFLIPPIWEALSKQQNAFRQQRPLL